MKGTGAHRRYADCDTGVERITTPLEVRGVACDTQETGSGLRLNALCQPHRDLCIPLSTTREAGGDWRIVVLSMPVPS